MSNFEEVELTDSEGEEDSNKDPINLKKIVQHPKEPALIKKFVYISPPKPITPPAPIIAKHDSSDESQEDMVDFIQPPVARRPSIKSGKKNHADFFEREEKHRAHLEETNQFDSSSEEEEVQAFDDVANEPEKKKDEDDDEDVFATAATGTNDSQQAKTDPKTVSGSHDLWSKAKFPGLFYRTSDFILLCKEREKQLGIKVDKRTGIPKGHASIMVDRFDNKPLYPISGVQWLKASGKIVRMRPFKHPETGKMWRGNAII